MFPGHRLRRWTLMRSSWARRHRQGSIVVRQSRQRGARPRCGRPGAGLRASQAAHELERMYHSSSGTETTHQCILQRLRSGTSARGRRPGPMPTSGSQTCERRCAGRFHFPWGNDQILDRPGVPSVALAGGRAAEALGPLGNIPVWRFCKVAYGVLTLMSMVMVRSSDGTHPSSIRTHLATPPGPARQC